MLEMTDTFGDTLTARISSGRVEFAGRYSEESIDEERAWYFDPNSQAIQDLRDFLGRVTGSTNSTQHGVRASQVSFNEALMRLAALHDKTITFAYSKGDGKIIEHRRLRPASIFTNKKGDLVVSGHDPDRASPRAYRIDRIKGEVRVA